MTPYIDPKATIGAGTRVGPYSVVWDDVIVGRDCSIGSHVILHPGTRIGDGVRIDDHTIVGKRPLRSALSATTSSESPAPAEVGAGSLLGASVVIYAGAVLGRGVLVADLATIREGVRIGELTIVGRGVAIENGCVIGRRCKLETNCYITAFSVLEDFVFVAPGVVTTNDNFVGRTEERFRHFRGVTVRKGGRVGANATILPGKVIAEDTLVGAGALVTRDTPPRKIVVGVPARPVRDVPQEQLLESQGWE